MVVLAPPASGGRFGGETWIWVLLGVAKVKTGFVQF